MPLLVSDFRCRRVGVGWLALFGAVAVLTTVTLYPFCRACLHTGINCGLLVMLGLLLWIYFRLRHGLRRLRYCLGSGDVWLLMASAPLFAPAAFLRFLIFSCLLSLLWWVAAGRKHRRTIPFAGMLGLTLWGVALLNLFRLWNP